MTLLSPSIFLSHSSRDHHLAEQLWKALEKRGHGCWIAPHSIQPSERWPAAIRRGVREAKIVVLLFTSNSDASEEVETELRFAKQSGVPIVPLRLEAIEPENLDYYIGGLQWISAVEPPLADQLESVIAQIERALSRSQDEKSHVLVIVETQNSTLNSDEAGANITDSEGQKLQISKKEFLSQCVAGEKLYFEDVLAFCESHPSQIIIDWGTKGFSVKDKNRRQILWMFPQEGANSKSNINARLQKLTDEEKAQIMEILRSNGISKGLSWRPGDLPLAELKKIINLVCGT